MNNRKKNSENRKFPLCLSPSPSPRQRPWTGCWARDRGTRGGTAYPGYPGLRSALFGDRWSLTAPAQDTNTRTQARAHLDTRVEMHASGHTFLHEYKNKCMPMHLHTTHKSGTQTQTNNKHTQAPRTVPYFKRAYTVHDSRH